MIEITVESQFKGYSRFNVMVMCGGFNASGDNLYVTSFQGDGNQSVAHLEAEDADKIELITYIIPKSLPKGKNAIVADTPPFTITICVKDKGGVVHSAEHQINGWVGSVVKLNLEI